jgi:YD repeat-containing protein
VQTAQVQGESGAESWNYDALGNTVHHAKADGAYTTTTYDYANRTIKTVSHSKGDDGKWQDSTSQLFYDAAGNVGVTKVSASTYGFDEVHVYDARYESQTKSLHNTWVRKARKLTGTSTFT